MISRNRRAGRLVSCFVAGLLLSPIHLHADKNRKPAPARGSSPKEKGRGEQGARLPGGKTVRASRRGRQKSYRQRLATLRLQPQRVEEIQRALIQSGYLTQEPTGKWDDQTRAAMRNYQADHGFPTTGLPEAKTLMKLGLGPHPLPEGVDPSVRSRASADASAQPAPVAPSNPHTGPQPPATDPPDEDR